MAYIGRQLARGENKLFDDISSSFNGSTTVFNLTVASVATSTATPFQLFVSLGGVMQKPNTDFTTAGNQITFTTAPAAGLSCWIMMQGDTIDQAAIPDASVTPSKISGSNFAFSGDLRLKDADGSHYVGFASPSTVAANKVWTLPAADGSASQYLQTNGSGVLAWSTVSIGGATGIDFNDNVKARFGTGNDLEIFHNASNSVINDAGTGDLLLQVGGSTKATVSSTGFDITGALTVSTNAVITGNLTVSGTTTTINTQTLDVEDKNVVIGKVSSPSDTTADGGGWTLKGATDKTFNWVNATDAWTSSEHIHLLDNKKLFVGGASGTTDGLLIHHDGSNSFIDDTGTGYLRVRGSEVRLQKVGSTEDMLTAIADGAVTLYHDNSAKLATTSGGINVTGAINVNGSALSTAPTITATANGSITANEAIIVEADGKVAGVTGYTASLGTEQEYYNDTPRVFACDFDSTTGKLIVVYSTDANQNQLYAKVGTISGNSVSYGSAVAISDTSNTNASYEYALSMACGNGKVVVCFTQSGTGPNMYARAGTISGTSITFGTVITMQSGAANGSSAICYDSDKDKFVALVSNDDSGNQCESQIFTVSGSNTITVADQGRVLSASGDESNFLNIIYVPQQTAYYAIYVAGKGEDPNTGHAGSGYAKGVVGTINGAGSQLTWGTPATLGTDNKNNIAMCYVPSTQQVAVAYLDRYSSYRLESLVCVVNWTNKTSSIGNYHVIESSGNSSYKPTISSLSDTEPTVLCAYKYSPGLVNNIGTITSGNASISWAGRQTVDSSGDVRVGGSWGKFNMPKVGPGKFAIVARDQSNTKGWVILQQFAATDLTSENFIGFAAAGYSNGDTATVKVTGNTTTGSSLTPGQKYFVQQDGTIALTADSPSVTAGRALTSTSLLINTGD
jgi:hypothetical protein